MRGTLWIAASTAALAAATAWAPSAGAAGDAAAPCDAACAAAAACCDAASSPTYWGGVEYLLWFRQGRKLPPLVTSSPAGTPRSQAGVLPDADVWFGGERADDGAESGLGLSLGMWLDPCRRWGAGASFWTLDEETLNFSAASDAQGRPTIARPFFNVDLAREDAVLVAFNDPQAGPLDAGRVDMRGANDALGGDVYLRYNWVRTCLGSLDLVGGYQFARIDDELTASSSLVSLDAGSGLPVGTTVDLRDRFRARNDFHGAQLGVLGEVRHRCWTFTSLAKVGFGNMRERVAVDGRTVLADPGGGQSTFPGGMLALPSNIGTVKDNEFVVAPEVRLQLAYQLSCCWSVAVGYSFLYWSSAAMAADQIDRRIDPDQFNGGGIGSEPALVLRDTDFWVQGLNFSLSGRF